MEIHQITYDGKKYTVYEPTLDIWQELTLKQTWSSDFELAVTLISWITGLTEEEVNSASARSIINAADGIVEYYTNQSHEFYETFTFNEKKYKFIDIPNISFAEYIDIDDILNKQTSDRIKNLNVLMALFYRELDEDGNYLPYDIERVKKTALTFKKLPIKYLQGSSVFFYHIDNILSKNIRFYFPTRIWFKLQKNLMKRRIKTLSAGIRQSSLLPGKIYLRCQRWLKSIILKFSTI